MRTRRRAAASSHCTHLHTASDARHSAGAARRGTPPPSLLPPRASPMVAGLIHEMRHNERIAQLWLLDALHQHSLHIHQAMLAVGVLINMVIMMTTLPSDSQDCTTAHDVDCGAYNNLQFTHWTAAAAVQLLGYTLLGISSACLLEHCVSSLPLTLRSSWHEFGVSLDFPSMWPLRITVARLEPLDSTDEQTQAVVARWRSVAKRSQSELAWYVARHTPLLIMQDDWWLIYYLLSISNCVLGLKVHSFFFVPALLDVVVRSRLLQKVIEAVTVNKDSLALTFLLVAVVIYQFTIIGTLFFRDDYIWHYETSTARKVVVDLCATTAECFMNSFYLGLNYGGLAQGLQDIRDKWDYDPFSARIRWFVDLLFYVSVIVMLLNIIFGIVIDTFAQQRDLQKQIKEDMENVCFVCGIDRNTFDRKHPQGFEHHRKHEHNIWHYLNFVIHLRRKNVTDYTGPESYVKQMLELNDLSFFPILKTSSIIFEDVSNEVLLERVEKLSTQLSETTQRLESFMQS